MKRKKLRRLFVVCFLFPLLLAGQQTPDLILNPASENIRYRHVIKEGVHWYILFNEEETPVKTQFKIQVNGQPFWLDEFSGEAFSDQLEEPVDFEPHELKIIMVKE